MGKASPTVVNGRWAYTQQLSRLALRRDSPVAETLFAPSVWDVRGHAVVTR